MDDPANAIGCTAIIDSIEKRWAKADQDVFIAAVILNPFVKATAFSPQVPFLTQAGVLMLLKRLYQRFFSVSETPVELDKHMRQLFSNIEDYFGGVGICANMVPYISDLNDRTQHTGESPDPVAVYKGISPITSTTPPPPLFKLAYHILSICPNSASCERLFSIFGNTLTKLRNRLGNRTLTSLAELKMHIRDEHLNNGETKQRMKRFYGNRSQTNAPLEEPVSQHPISASLPTNETEIDDVMDIDPVLWWSSDGVTDQFNHITESFGRQASSDDNDGGPAMDEELPSTISIAELFDFTQRAWILPHERSASRSLHEELELYELIDLDGTGEGSVDVEIDHVLESILHHV